MKSFACRIQDHVKQMLCESALGVEPLCGLMTKLLWSLASVLSVVMVRPLKTTGQICRL